MLKFSSYIAEFVGTFVLVLFCAGSSLYCRSMHPVAAVVLPAIAAGLVVFAAIFFLHKYSGAHINPAVTVAMLFAGKLGLRKAVIYIVMQFAGGIAAGALLRLINSDPVLGATMPKSGSLAISWVTEVMLTLGLLSTVFYCNGRTVLKTAALVGLVVMLACIAGGPVSGASMNPARSAGPALFGVGLKFLWVYITAPLSAAVLIALAAPFKSPQTSDKA